MKNSAAPRPTRNAARTPPAARPMTFGSRRRQRGRAAAAAVSTAAAENSAITVTAPVRMEQPPVVDGQVRPPGGPGRWARQNCLRDINLGTQGAAQNAAFTRLGPGVFPRGAEPAVQEGHG